MRFDKKWLNKRWVGYTIAACSAVVLYLILSHLDVIGGGLRSIAAVLSPILFGMIIAYILDPFVRFFEKRVFARVESPRARRMLGIVCGYVLLIAFVALLLVALIPQLVNSAKILIGNIQGYMDTIDRYIEFLDSRQDGIDLSGLAEIINNAITAVKDAVLARGESLLHGSIRLGAGIITGVISVIISAYFLSDKKRIQRDVGKFFAGMLPEKKYNFLSSYWSRCNQILERYILFNLLDGLIVGLICTAFMAIMRMPYIALISVMVGITNLIPTFGPLVGGAIGAFILVLVNPWQALWFLIFIVAVQTFDGYILKPKLYGNTFGVPSLWILIMIIIGARTFGVWGMLIAIPLAAILSFTFREYIWPWMKKRRATRKEENKVPPAENDGKADAPELNTGEVYSAERPEPAAADVQSKREET